MIPISTFFACGFEVCSKFVAYKARKRYVHLTTFFHNKNLEGVHIRVFDNV